MGPLGWSRRSIWVVNDPALVRSILTEQADAFPKSDLMVNALEPLIGDAMFVSSGDVWRRQRRMIDPAFTLIRLSRAFPAMSAAVDDYEAELDRRADSGQAFSLDQAMTQLTADIICRTVFSTSLASQTARDVFEAFARFEASVAEVKVWRLIVDAAWTKAKQSPETLAACALIRRHLGDLLDRHMAAGDARPDDIAAAVIAARDEAGAGFSRDELIDQLGVLFLAGHETTASALTWAFFILAMYPQAAARIREEVRAVAGEGPLGFEAMRALPYTRNVFRETLRLYPPITFLPRVALRDGRIGRQRVRRGALIMIAPWVLHRHELYWQDPDLFDPDRFLPEREAAMTAGAYIPFGAGPRVCVGAAVAQTEATLILARLCRRYKFHVDNPAAVRPVARLTTRPAEEIRCRIERAA